MHGKNKSTAVIVAGGDLTGAAQFLKELSDDVFCIAADHGVDAFFEAGKVPDLLVGDMDSANGDWQLLACEKILLPAEKDETDTEKAFQIAAERGFQKVILLGGTGSRMDHTLANFEVLTGFFRKGMEVSIQGENNVIHWVDAAHPLRVKSRPQMGVSLLPVDEVVEGVTTKGLKYPLKGESLYKNQSRGISNEWADEVAEVSVTSGVLLAILYKD